MVTVNKKIGKKVSHGLQFLLEWEDMKLYDPKNWLKERVELDLLKKLPDQIALVDATLPIPSEIKAHQIVGITQNLEAKELIDLAVSTGIRFILQNSRTKFVREVALAAELMTVPTRYLGGPEARVLSHFNTEKSVSFALRHSKARDETMNLVVQFIKKIPGGELIKDSVRLLADEMFTNALYNAPANKSGKHITSHLPRTAAIELGPDCQARMTLSFDEKRLFLGCEDPFGSLDEHKFIVGLHSKYRGDELTPVNMGPGGAGIGCRMLLDRSTEFYVVCEKGLRTFFGCTLPLGQSAREFEGTFKNLYIDFFNEGT